MSWYVPGATISLHKGMVGAGALAHTLQTRYCHSNSMIHAHGFPTKKNMMSSECYMVMWQCKWLQGMSSVSHSNVLMMWVTSGQEEYKRE